jgi:hypothetical protein
MYARPAVGLRVRPGTVLAMAAVAKMRAVVLDCPEPRALAEFYRALVGGDITYADDDWSTYATARTCFSASSGPRTTSRPTGPARSTASSSPGVDAL